MTYDIRALVPDLLRDDNPLPTSISQMKKITSAARRRLPGWIEQTVRPVLENALNASGLQAELRIDGKDKDKLIIAYPAVKTGTGYTAVTVQLECGARATGMGSFRREEKGPAPALYASSTHRWPIPPRQPSERHSGTTWVLAQVPLDAVKELKSKRIALRCKILYDVSGKVAVYR